MPTGFGQSDYGQTFYGILTDLSLTPEEWGQLDAVQQRFLRSAHAERNRREQEAQKEATS